MRARYSAYAHQLEPYLLTTWYTGTRPSPPLFDESEKTRWLGLEIKCHEMTGTASAIVEFVARYKVGGRAHRLHETSRFVCEDGRWFYVDGDHS